MLTVQTLTTNWALQQIIWKETNKTYVNKKQTKPMVTVINLNNIIDTTTFIKTKLNTKRYVSCSSFRDQLSILQRI